MQKEKYLIIPRSKKLDEYKAFNSFILPFKDYSVGYDTYFELDEINELSQSFNVYVMLNKFLHRDIEKFSKIYKLFNKNIMFIVEDLGLLNIIDKDRVIIFENHIESNYKSINYLLSLGYNNVVLNNDLTIKEINDIRKNTKSKLYFFLITRNMLMYSKRKLFSGNKYIKELESLDYLIIDTNSMSDLELKVTLEYYDNEKLIEILDTDYYFLEEEIKYKVGDIK